MYWIRYGDSNIKHIHELWFNHLKQKQKKGLNGLCAWKYFHSERGQLSEWNKLWLFSTILCHRHNTSGNLTWFSQQNLKLTNMEFEPIRIPVFRSMRMCIPQMPYFGPAAWTFLERFGVETWYVESVLKYHKPNTITIMIYNNDLFIVYMYHIVLLVGFLTIVPHNIALNILWHDTNQTRFIASVPKKCAKRSKYNTGS